MEVGTLGDVVVEELEEGIRLFLLEPDDASREALVDVQGLLLCYRMSADNRVLWKQKQSASLLKQVAQIDENEPRTPLVHDV